MIFGRREKEETTLFDSILYGIEGSKDENSPDLTLKVLCSNGIIVAIYGPENFGWTTIITCKDSKLSVYRLRDGKLCEIPMEEGSPEEIVEKVVEYVLSNNPPVVKCYKPNNFSWYRYALELMERMKKT